MNRYIYIAGQLSFVLALTWGVGALLHAMGNPLLVLWVVLGLPVSLKVLFMIEERFSL